MVHDAAQRAPLGIGTCAPARNAVEPRCQRAHRPFEAFRRYRASDRLRRTLRRVSEHRALVCAPRPAVDVESVPVESFA